MIHITAAAVNAWVSTTITAHSRGELTSQPPHQRRISSDGPASGSSEQFGRRKEWLWRCVKMVSKLLGQQCDFSKIFFFLIWEKIFLLPKLVFWNISKLFYLREEYEKLVKLAKKIIIFWALPGLFSKHTL